MIRLAGFQGEIPRLEPRFLPPSNAQIAQNVKIESGALIPYKLPLVAETLDEDASTIYRDGSAWLSWPSRVDVVPGPVATDRLYYTGNSKPRVRVGLASYALELHFPDEAPDVAMRSVSEYLLFDSEEKPLRLQHGNSRTSSSGWTAEVSVQASTATVNFTHAGATAAQAQTLLNNIRYRMGAASGAPGATIKSLKVIRITEIQDAGGQDYDANRNRIGSDTRILINVGCVVKVGGTTLDYDIGEPGDQSSDNTGGQNDPPTLTTTPDNPSYAQVGDPSVDLFDSTTINTIEGQNVIRIELTVDGLSNGAKDKTNFETYLHAYTYVTVLDEESAPSPLSKPLDWSPGQTVRISGFAPPPAARGVNRIRIYRSQTSSAEQTDLYFVGELTDIDTGGVSGRFFDDNLDEVPLGEPITTTDFQTPPDDLEGLTGLHNGMMAAYSGKELYFCEPYKPHAWPRKYVLTMDHQIMGLASIGSSVAVLTKGYPFIVQGTHPENMVPTRLEVNYPCLASRSVVDMGYFAAYASTEGLVTISESGGAQLVTKALFTRGDWARMTPSSFICSQHEGRYIISYDPNADGSPRQCGIVDLTGANPFYVRLNWKPKAFFFEIGGGDLYFLDHDDRTIHKFDANAGDHARMVWRSKPFVLPGYINYARILIDGRRLRRGSSLAVRIFADGERVDTVNEMNDVVTLPSGFTARTWEIEITGTASVSAVYMAQTVEEIMQAVVAT